MTRRGLLCAALACLTGLGPAAAGGRSRRPLVRTLVTLAREGRTGEEARVRRFLARRGYRVVERLQFVPILVVLLDDEGRRALSRHPDVQGVQTDDVAAPTRF